MRSAIAVCLLAGLFAITASAADPISTRQLKESEPRWGRLSGANLSVEGRAMTVLGEELKLRGISLRFLAEQELERPPSWPYVRVDGTLVQEDGRWLLRVRRLGEWKSDETWLNERRRAGDANDPDFLKSLGDWISERAEFYSDPALRELATREYARAVTVQESKLKIDDAQGFLNLAEQARRYGLSEERRRELLHSATRAELLQEGQKRNSRYEVILDNVRKRFPHSARELPEVPEELEKQYREHPLETYRTANPATRNTLDRLLYLETALKLITTETKPNGENGNEIAARLESLTPEYASRAAEHRARQLEYYESQIPTMERTELLDFQKMLRDLEMDERALAAGHTWIKARYERDLAGRTNSFTNVQRARDELELAGDREAALARLTSTLRKDPGVVGGKELLATLGYTWHDGRPVKPEEVPEPVANRMAAAVRDGRILPGMTDEQVRAALGGLPETVVRIAARHGSGELWYYPEQRMTIYLESARERSGLRVTRIVGVTREVEVRDYEGTTGAAQTPGKRKKRN